MNQNTTEGIIILILIIAIAYYWSLGYDPIPFKVNMTALKEII